MKEQLLAQVTELEKEIDERINEIDGRGRMKTENILAKLKIIDLKIKISMLHD